jgi:signal transduction histidine kinase
MPLIFVVDDQTKHAQALHQLLVDECEVLVMSSGVDALAACGRQQPDLILLAQTLPDMSGFEVCDRLRGEPRTRAVPVIFLLDESTPELQAQAFEHGGVDLICKPFVDVVVKARVRTQLSLKLASESFARSQIELFQRDRLASVGRTIAGIAQELSSPLGNALIAGCTIQDDLAQMRSRLIGHAIKRSDLEQHVRVCDESVNLVLSNLQRTLSIVDSFLQSTADNFGDQRRSFSLLELVTEVVASLEEPLAQQQVRCVVDTGEAEFDRHLLSFRSALGKVLTTLIQNAMRHAYREHGGEVNIRIRPYAGAGGDQVMVVVQDHGAGMSAHTLGRVFDPFFSTRFGASRSEPGLYIVRNLVTFALGGQMQVDSTTGVGTTVRLILPLVSPEARRPAPAAP